MLVHGRVVIEGLGRWEGESWILGGGEGREQVDDCGRLWWSRCRCKCNSGDAQGEIVVVVEKAAASLFCAGVKSLVFTLESFSPQLSVLNF